MVSKKSLQRLATVSLALSFGMVMTPRFNLPAGAQSPNQGGVKISQSFQPPDRGAPARTADGGTRGCGAAMNDKGLTSLTPARHLALTVSDSPTFFWYVPKSSAQELEFKLVDGSNEDKVIYQTTLPAPSKSGIISVSLPAGTGRHLENGKMYHWYFSMVCNKEDPTAKSYIDGWIERTQLDAPLASQVQGASRQELPGIYAQAGIWHEALATLAELRRNYPDDQVIASQWQEFLTSVQLGEFSNEPLIALNATR